MCHRNRSSNVKHKSRGSSAKKVSTATVVARKSRTKTRKPKYLSLKLQLSTKTQKPTTQKQQLNLFPLHPEKDHMQEHDHVNDDVTFLLDTDNSTTTTLHDLLDTTTATSEEDKEALLSTETATYYGGGNGLLEKAAMRSKERDASEERWVSYWEVVEEVSSCSGGTTAVEAEERRKLVGLKLDYEEILNAWCDKGPLYVEGESPQTVPDLHASSNAFSEEWRSVGNLWQVPEIGSGTSKDEVGAKQGWKLGQREASVLRYKEKRQNRLFSKRIRYEVRKLNAEKRPRLKGRFVKRDADD